MNELTEDKKNSPKIRKRESSKNGRNLQSLNFQCRKKNRRFETLILALEMKNIS
jgi:hypothetical protein